jgi:hypothetical protein
MEVSPFRYLVPANDKSAPQEQEPSPLTHSSFGGLKPALQKPNVL